MYCRLIFGDNTSPSNFEIVALARSQLAIWLWNQRKSTTNKVRQYLPPIKFPETPNNDIMDTWAKTISDALNKGVINPDSSQMP